MAHVAGFNAPSSRRRRTLFSVYGRLDVLNSVNTTTHAFEWVSFYCSNFKKTRIRYYNTPERDLDPGCRQSQLQHSRVCTPNFLLIPTACSRTAPSSSTPQRTTAPPSPTHVEHETEESWDEGDEDEDEDEDEEGPNHQHDQQHQDQGYQALQDPRGHHPSPASSPSRL
ncbi:hypothetical protein CVT26_011949 [Gymnopilus dilepis]|uniref:Uncharacterized protein n=1 Tax=Gymnopilus dilepis TaxID=231916 RepID=A0A409VYJ0_9AGAR|nr:hypothetical protein CVT26_011949 [Gymnopilus dilepis]